MTKAAFKQDFTYYLLTYSKNKIQCWLSTVGAPKQEITTAHIVSNWFVTVFSGSFHGNINLDIGL